MKEFLKFADLAGRQSTSFKQFFTKILSYIYNKFKAKLDIIECKIKTKLEPECDKNLVIKQNKFPNFASIIEVLGTRQKNKFYPANPSLWVVFLSCFIGLSVILFVSILHSQEFISAVYKQFFVALVGVIIALVFWISLFYKEKMYGYHSDIIRRNIMLGFWVFLFTEGLCFMSLFWTFFHAMLAASTHIGQFNPGEGVVNYYLSEGMIMHPCWALFFFLEYPETRITNIMTEKSKYSFDHTFCVMFHFNLYDKGQLIDPYGYPLLNTVLLLTSAAVLNSSHVKLKLSRYLHSLVFLFITIFIGFIFLFVQFLEIRNCTLQYNDGIYACTFYSLTGLHGIHVILGVFALIMCFVNFIKGNYTRLRHDTFWCSVAYWHFVDIVWVLVYLLIYCWPSCFYFADYMQYTYIGEKEHCFYFSTSVFEENIYKKNLMLNIDLTGEFVSLYSEFIKQKIAINYANFEKSVDFCINLMTYSYCEKMANDNIEVSVSEVHEALINALLSGKIDSVFLDIYSAVASNLSDSFFEKCDITDIKRFSVLEHKVTLLYYYNELYNLRTYINYEEITRDKHLYAVSLNIFHTMAFDYLLDWAINDFKTWKGKIKFTMLFILYHLNINWAFTFASRYTPYFMNSTFEWMWGDLLYTRKPKWAIINTD